jgi:CheY-like chemotaxis protein
MDSDAKTFGATATSLARNPLGIIALFLVLVYGFASLVTAFAGSFSVSERVPLVYFLVLFPVLVLAVFGWLVSRHSEKLYGPSDYKDEQNFLRMRLAIAASLSAADVSKGNLGSAELNNIELVSGLSRTKLMQLQGKEILWVDDNPGNNVYVRQALDAAGIRVRLAMSTDEALAAISQRKFAAIISDMGRREGPREGYVLLDRLRELENRTPFFIYAGSNAPQHRTEALAHGAQGSTNSAKELFEMVTQAAIDT